MGGPDGFLGGADGALEDKEEKEEEEEEEEEQEEENEKEEVRRRDVKVDLAFGRGRRLANRGPAIFMHGL